MRPFQTCSGCKSAAECVGFRQCFAPPRGELDPRAVEALEAGTRLHKYQVDQPAPSVQDLGERFGTAVALQISRTATIPTDILLASRDPLDVAAGLARLWQRRQLR